MSAAPMAGGILPPGFEALVEKMAARHAPPKAARKRRASPLMAAAESAVARGEMPPVLEFGSQSNYTYNRHADRIYKLMVAGDLDGLRAFSVEGRNTYARALVRYRDLAIRWLQRGMAE